MVNEGRGRLFRRKDGKYLIYLPKDLAEDSMFPFKKWQANPRGGEPSSIRVKTIFRPGENKIIIEEWIPPKPT